MSEKIEILAFTDGAAKGNPGPGGWGAVLLIGGATVRELGAAGGATTNNRMEMTAALRALQWVAEFKDVDQSILTLVTDSTYVLRGATEWLRGWKKKGWRTASGGEVANRDLWELLDGAMGACPKVVWRYVPGHSGFPGNERADAIASAFAATGSFPLYDGSLDGYGHDLTRLPEAGAAMRNTSKPSKGAGSGAKGSAHSYVSLVDGVVRTHRTWGECERLVKGRSGVRFRKTSSAADERELIAQWGGRLDDPGAGR